MTEQSAGSEIHICACGESLPPKKSTGPARSVCDDCKAAKKRARAKASYVPRPRGKAEPCSMPVISKLCTACDTTKVAVDFNRNRSKVDGLQAECRDCHNARLRRSYDLDPSKASRRRRARTLRQHGTDWLYYEYLLAEQGGTCAICGRPPQPDVRLNIDHDHEHCPGEYACVACIRGLLCADCNGNEGHHPGWASYLEADEARKKFWAI